MWALGQPVLQCEKPNPCTFDVIVDPGRGKEGQNASHPKRLDIQRRNTVNHCSRAGRDGACWNPRRIRSSWSARMTWDLVLRDKTKIVLDLIPVTSVRKNTLASADYFYDLRREGDPSEVHGQKCWVHMNSVHIKFFLDRSNILKISEFLLKEGKISNLKSTFFLLGPVLGL